MKAATSSRRTPRPGPALAYNIQAAFSDTVPLLYVQNNDSKANPFGKRMYLDYIKLICTTAPASGTGARFAIKTDPALRTISTNNTTAITPTSPNSDVATQSVCSINVQNSADGLGAVGLLRVGPSRRERQRGRHPGGGRRTRAGLRSGRSRRLPRPDGGASSVPGRKVSCLPPIILGPNSALTLYAWFPGNAATGLSYEFEMGWWER